MTRAMARPILVGYDPRTSDRAPVRLGVMLARLTGAPLIVASVQAGQGPRPIAMSHEQVLPYATVQPDPDLLHDCAPQVEEIRLELEPYGIRADCTVLIGTSAAKTLHEAAETEDAGLLVVGSSRRGDRGRVLAGSTAARLLSGSPCPVAVAPLGWAREEPPSAIGAAFRDTEDGREGLRAALALARRARARLVVVTVVEEGLKAALEAEPSYVAGQAGKSAEDVVGEYELAARLAAQKALEDALEGHDGIETEVETWVGEPAEVLVERSGHLDLLVCGSRGYGPVRAVVLGAVAHRVVAEARCPVTVVPRGRESRLEMLMTEAPGATAHA
jgi:nucleotide-binding universal stress UspA family protein